MKRLPLSQPEPASPTLPPRPESRDEIGPLMLDITREWRYEFDRRLRPLGLSQVRWWTLYEVWISPEPMSQNELAKRLAVEGPTMVRLLDRLQSDGLILRNEDPQDRRRKLITITDKASRMLDPIKRMQQELRAEYLQGVSDKSLKECLTVLRRIDLNQQRIRNVTTATIGDVIED